MNNSSQTYPKQNYLTWKKLLLEKDLNFVPTPAKPTRVALISDINIANKQWHLRVHKTSKSQLFGQNITILSYLKIRTGDNLALLQLMSARMGGMKASYC